MAGQYPRAARHDIHSNHAPRVQFLFDTIWGMKTLTKELWMEVPTRRAVVSLHREVERLVQESGVQDGLVLVKATAI